jgi:hypothetical protein
MQTNLTQSWTMASVQPSQPRDWYQGTETSRLVVAAEMKYRKMLLIFRREITANEFDIYEAAKAKLFGVLSPKEREMLASESTSIKSLLDILEQGKLQYDTKPACKARKWLVVFSSKVNHYGSVIDVLIQQNPQYVSLAWGAMKFLFMVNTNVFKFR